MIITANSRTLVLAVVLVSLCACQQSEPPSAAPAPTEKPVANTPMSVVEILVGQARDVGSSPSVQPQTTRDPIALTVKTFGASKGVQLEAKVFRLADGSLVSTQSKRLVTDGSATSEFTFNNEQGWSAGRYLVEVKLDDKLSGQRDVDVVDWPAQSTAPK